VGNPVEVLFNLGENRAPHIGLLFAFHLELLHQEADDRRYRHTASREVGSL